MRKRLIAATVVLTLLVAGTAWAMSRRDVKAATIHGPDLFSVDASAGADLSAALMLFHDKFCGWELDATGRKSDPSFRQSTRSWNSSSAPQNAQTAFSRSTTEFKDKQGHQVHLEVAHEAGRPFFVVVEYQGAGGPITVTNGLLAELQHMGVTVQ